MDRLKGKTALVIGASTGIGYAVCRLFAQEGADVAVASSGHEAEKAALADEIHARGRQCFALRVDVAREDEVAAAIAASITRFGHLDILVNNAGIAGYRGPVQAQTAEEWDRVLDVNLRGTFFGVKHILPHMIERGYGRIVNCASQLAHKPAARSASYCASKAGVVALTAAVAQEVAQYGITVNVVCPGPTDTPLWRLPGNEQWKKAKLESLPMRRVGEPIEVAWAFVYLASDEASFLTGQTISPNGGDVMW
ncbi:MAG: SDR family NAD(P)-dependent oxidoreductase [Chloroflexota bacterium]